MTFLIFLKQKWVPQTSLRFILRASAILTVLFLATNSNALASTSPKKKIKEVWILPLITFYDVSRNTTYNWWSETATESLEAQKHSQYLMNFLGQASDQVLQFLDPQKRGVKFRDNLKKTVLTEAELLEISQSLGTEIVLTGDVQLEPSPVIPDGKRLKMDIKILRAPQFREIGQVVRLVDLHSSDYAQLLEVGGDAWVDLKTSVEKQLLAYDAKKRKEKLEIVVNGSFDHQQLKVFHKSLKSKITGIKSISPGFLDKDSFGIFVEYEGRDAQALSEDLKHLEFKGFMTQVVSSSNSQVIFDVHPQGAVK